MAVQVRRRPELLSGGWYSAATVTGNLGENDRTDEKSRAGFWFETVCQVLFKLYYKVKQKMG